VSTILVLPPPLRGRVGEGGNSEALDSWTPTPNPSPQGGAEHTTIAASSDIANRDIR